MMGLLPFFLSGVMIRRFLTLTFVVLSSLVAASAQSIWSSEHLQQVRSNISQPYYASAYQQLISEADALLDVQPLSVMLKKDAPASGDKHDYMSIGRYTWPDPTKPDGLPYITRDGESNPELELYDRQPLGKTASRVVTLTLAYYFSGDERYARKASELLRVWFLDPATRMNPHLRYAQVVKGKNNNLGRCYGVIDTYSFVEMVQALPLLEQSQSFSKRDAKAIKRWFSQLIHWLTTDPQGIEESNTLNNHSIAYDAQLIAFAIYSGDVQLATKSLNEFAERRLFRQVEPDGSQPHELRRTLAYHYSWYNLNHIIDIVLMAQHLGLRLDDAVSSDGRSFYGAIDYLLPYTGKPRSAWPYQQLSGWDQAQQHFIADLYRVATYINPQRTDYLELYQRYRKLDLSDRFNLLYYQPNATDHTYAWAQGQLRVAVDAARTARNDKTNLAEHRVSPRTIKADGSLGMVGPRDWCCGFFPGELWQMYEYTHDDYWRQEALSATWLIEDVKYHRGSHDLGFVCNNTFGRGYEDTREQSLRDVLLYTTRTLCTRYNPTVGCIRSWDHNPDKWKYPVIVDNMMNLEMLFHVTQLTGDSTYWKIAVSHADVTMRNHFRPDASSFHVVDYDPTDGSVRIRQTHQGYSDDSFWSRGQGWGLYGYTMCYRFTRDPKYLEQAQRIAQFWFSLANMPTDGVPYWDMKEPTIAQNLAGQDDPSVPRDASAAALIASALYELATYVPEQHDFYRQQADHIMDSLDAHYRAATGGDYGFLLLHSTGHKPANSEVDVPLSYADYYYLEAAMRRTQFK